MLVVHFTHLNVEMLKGTSLLPQQLLVWGFDKKGEFIRRHDKPKHQVTAMINIKFFLF